MAKPPAPVPAAELIAQLRDARTPLARVRVIVRAWRAVRSLSPRDRSNLITQLGLEGADDLVEAIAAHEGTKPPAELIQAVNQMQRLDPEALRAVATRMRDPRQRGAVIKEGLQKLETNLAGPPPMPPGPPGPPGPPAGFTARPPAPPPQPPVTVMPATSWPLREAAPSSPAPAPVPQVVAPTPPPAPAPAVTAEPAAPPVVVTPVPVPPKPVLSQPAPPEQPAPPSPQIPAPAPEAAAAAPDVRGSLAEELAAVPVLTSRFRLLRRRLSAVRQLSPGELRGVLEAFADGWARRRVLSELLEAGIPGRTADAIDLVDALQSAGDRSWCLGILADSRTLSSDEKAILLQAAPTAAGRRRLGLRLGEA